MTPVTTKPRKLVTKAMNPKSRIKIISKSKEKKVKEPIKFPEPVTKYDFPVELRELKTVEGIKIPEKKAVVRTDTNTCLGVVGSNYQIFSNKDVITQIEKTLPIELGTRTISITDGGMYMFARYLSPKIKSVEVAKGDIVQFGIEIFNSYNGKIALGMRMLALRLICTNGMTSPRSFSTITVRHIAGANIADAQEEFQKKVKLFIDYSDCWKNWLKITPEETQIKQFLTSRIPQKNAREIIRNKYESDKDKSLWGFYNAVTWYGTHVLKPTFKDALNDKVTSVAPLHRDASHMQFRYARQVIEPFYSYKWGKN